MPAGVWMFAAGNVARRAPAAKVASRGSAADTIHSLARLSNGHPDEASRWVRNAAGQYGADIDTNLLATVTTRADAPTGWADLLLALAGTPGLPANPPDWGTHASRSAIRAFSPIFQDVVVMPGETVRVKAGLYLPGASSCTSVYLRVIDRWTGRQYDGAGNAWTSGASAFSVGQTSTDDAWLDIDETILSDTARLERSTYRVIIDAAAPAWDSSSYFYCSSPLVLPKFDLAAVIGHNLPFGSTVTLDPQPSGTGITLTPGQPSFYTLATNPIDPVQVWRLSIDVPAATTGFADRPGIGELWMGRATTMAWAPSFPFTIAEKDLGQVRIIGGRGRVDAYSDSTRASRQLGMVFKADDAGYKMIRDQLNHATLYGAEPCLILPVTEMEGATAIYHGNVGDEIAWSRTNYVRRGFTLAFSESPFPRFP